MGYVYEGLSARENTVAVCAWVLACVVVRWVLCIVQHFMVQVTKAIGHGGEKWQRVLGRFDMITGTRVGKRIIEHFI